MVHEDIVAVRIVLRLHNSIFSAYSCEIGKSEREGDLALVTQHLGFAFSFPILHYLPKDVSVFYSITSLLYIYTHAFCLSLPSSLPLPIPLSLIDLRYLPQYLSNLILET